jgi:heat-inducible transcriptional repressor
MTIELNSRSRDILQAIVQDYIQTAEPVGSRTVSRRHGLDLSPATIRNVMADLEDMGLLMQPHTSAGRVPTDLGLRFYVDTILEVGDISRQEQEAIRLEFAEVHPELDRVIKHCSRVLSSVSRHIGVVLAPRFSRLVLQQIQFVRMAERLVLVILVGLSGLVQNRIIEVDEDVKQEDLDRFNRYLNDILEGLTINEIKAKLVEQMREEKNQFDQMLSQALALSQKVFEDDIDEEDLYVAGQVNLLDYPEFARVESMKALFRTFEDKSILVKLLDNTLNASEVQIFIGSETEFAELEGCAVIASRYSRGTMPLGTLGVIGPSRLDYSKIIPVVDYTAKFVSKILETTL